MGKKDNTLLWVAGAGLVGWLLAPKELKEQITGGMPGIGIDLSGLLGGGLDIGGLLPEFKVPEFEWPAFPEGWIPNFPENPIPGWSEELKDWISGGGKFIAKVPELIDPNLPDTGKEGGGSLFDITPQSPTNIQNFARRATGVYGRQLTGAALTGTHLIRPLPFAGRVEKGFLPLREAAKRIGARATTKALPRALTEVVRSPLTGETSIRLTAKGLGKAGARTGVKVATLVGAKVGAKAAARAIPFVGQALLVVDVAADLARIFGADVTEWLGFSGLVSAFTGENPLETFFAGKPALAANNNMSLGGGLLGLPIQSEASYGGIEKGNGRPGPPIKSEAAYGGSSLGKGIAVGGSSLGKGIITKPQYKKPYTKLGTRF